jgi:hypothetical protein
MTNQAFPNYSSTSNVSPPQSSFFAWLAIGGLIIFALAGYFAAPGLLRQGFPVASFIVGIFLYLKHPTLYIGYTWWLWFLIALIRRLVDFRTGWDQQGFILISPYLVTLITVATFVRYLPRSLRIGALPFVLAMVALFYGLMVGLVTFEPIAVFRTALDWFAPVFFGFHIFVNWRNYPNYRQNTQTVFLWCVIVSGIYGVYQYLTAPEWDRIWLTGTKLVTMGTPEPLGIRVWSIMHSPGPFANVMMVGLLLMLSNLHPLNFVGSIAGYLSFLLSFVRSAWGGWVVGVLTLITNLRPKLQMRLVVTAMIMVLCVLPVVTVEPFATVINERLESVTNLQQDQSYKDRSESYDRNLNIALSSPLGRGIGGTWILDRDGKLVMVVLDSGILDLFFALGWFGAIPYIAGLVLSILSLFQGSEIRNDSFASTARSISLGVFFQMGLGSMMLGLSGLTLWGFIAMGMAAKKYHQQQLTSHSFYQQS